MSVLSCVRHLSGHPAPPNINSDDTVKPARQADRAPRLRPGVGKDWNHHGVVSRRLRHNACNPKSSLASCSHLHPVLKEDPRAAEGGGGLPQRRLTSFRRSTEEPNRTTGFTSLRPNRPKPKLLSLLSIAARGVSCFEGKEENRSVGYWMMRCCVGLPNQQTGPAPLPLFQTPNPSICSVHARWSSVRMQLFEIGAQ